MIIRFIIGSTPLAAIIILSGCVAREREPPIDTITKCDVRSLAAVFASPLNYQKRRFCGEAVAYLHDRALEVFPEGPLPADRFETAAFLDRKAELKARSRLDASGRVRLYLEAVVDLQMPCFAESDTGDTCVPYTHPIHLEVEKISFP